MLHHLFPFMLFQLQTAIAVIELNYCLSAKFIPQNKQCPTQMQKTTPIISSNNIQCQATSTDSVTENAYRVCGRKQRQMPLMLQFIQQIFSSLNHRNKTWSF